MTNVLYICQWLTEEIVQKRGLPTLNVSGTNRMARLAQALRAAGARVCIVSPATAMRLKWKGRVFHPGCATRSERFPLIFAWAMGIPFLSSLCEPLALFVSVFTACRKHKPALVMIYNYYPAVLFAGLVAKWRYGARLIFDIEDVCVPHFADWVGRGDSRPFQQLVGWFLLKLGLFGSDLVLAPSRRLMETAGTSKKHLIVTGCIKVDGFMNAEDKSPDAPLRVLISGKLDSEQGMDLILEAIEELHSRPSSKRLLEFHFCGFPDNEAAFSKRIDDLRKKGSCVIFHGSLSATAYTQLLKRADVCLAMQNPHGRHGNAKTPSKVYEYLSNGKVVIASNVGDFDLLPGDVINLCDYDLKILSDRLQAVANDWAQWRTMGERAAAYGRREFSYGAIGGKIIAQLK